MLKEGSKAPAFKLPSTEGEDVSLKDLGGKTVVLYFYPRDMTPGCTTEACDFRDARKALEKKGAVVYGVSKDSLETHAKFIDKYELNFPLLTDKKGEVMEKYGAWGEKTMYGKKVTGVIRTTVVIGPDGKVKRVFPNVKVKGHVEKVLAAIDE
jgi:thioredoxin-dependent peroxiredoxin